MPARTAILDHRDRPELRGLSIKMSSPSTGEPSEAMSVSPVSSLMMSPELAYLHQPACMSHTGINTNEGRLEDHCFYEKFKSDVVEILLFCKYWYFCIMID